MRAPESQRMTMRNSTIVTTERRLTIGFLAALVVLFVNAAVSYWNIWDLGERGRWVDHTRGVLVAISDLDSTIRDAELSHRSYLLTGSEGWLGLANKSLDRIAPQVEAIRGMTADNPGQKALIAQLEAAMGGRMAAMHRSAEARKAGVPVNPLREVGRGSEADRPLGEVLRIEREMNALENSLLERRESEARASMIRALATFTIATALAMSLVAVGYVLTRRYIDERRRSEATLREGEEQVRLILESTGEGLVGLDLEGRCIFSNSASRRMLGLAGKDDDAGFAGMMGRALTDLIGEGTAASRIAAAIGSGESEHAEVATFRRHDGTFLPVEFWTHPILRGGERIGTIVTFVDVTVRQRAEETMRLRDRALRSIAQGIFITDPKRKTEPLFYVNAAFERMTGYTLAEATGRDVRFLSGPGTDPAATDKIAAAFRDGTECSVELLAYRKDGSTFWASTSLSPVEDMTGKVAHFVGVMTDVTERKRAEAATAERTRLVTLAAEVGIALNRNDTLPEMLQRCCELIVEHLDGAFARIWTLDEGDDTLVLRASAGMYTHIDGPHGRVRVGEYKIGRIAQHREPHLTNSVADDPEIGDPEWAGREGMVAFAGYPLMVGGRVLGVIGMFARHPLTDDAFQEMATMVRGIALGIERKRTEEALREGDRQFRTLADSIPHLAWVAEPGGAISWFNRRWYEFTGTIPEQMEGWGWQSALDPSDLPRMVEKYKAAIAAGEAWEDTFPLRRADGALRWHLSRALPVRDDRGRIGRWFGTNTDVTEQKIAEAELQKAKESAEAASRSKSTFLANMSHELRTPLNAIIGYAEMLQEEAEDAGLDTYVADLKKVHGAGKHLLGLINDILDLSKIEAGKMDLFLETFDVREMIDGVVSTIAPLVEKNGNTLAVEVPEGIGTMHGDLTKVRQALFNLLSNASKFTENGTITLAAQRGVVDGVDWLDYRVTDSGIGMTEEQVKRLFQPFTQADASTTRKYGGTGLGLTITQRFCQMLGGDVVVESETGKGSTFTIHLPAEAHERPGEFRAIKDSPRAEFEGDGGSLVLVIDDDPTVCELIRRTLEKDGYRVAWAHDGRTALDMAKRLHPDAITLDVMMPGMDGWSVLGALKSDPGLAHIPVVMVTMIDEKRIGYSLGASDYLTKPIDRTRLVATLEKYRRTHAGGTILVVEDDGATREMVRKMLEEDGWTVVEAENGRIGLERLPEARPDLILLDLMMPVMDGFDFAAELRRRDEWRDTPILVMTAMDVSAEDRLRLNGHVLGILQKGSYSREALLEEIRREIQVHLARKPAAAKAAGG